MKDLQVIKHLALIMDGNRRWARNNKMDILLGHSRGGVDAARRAITFCLNNNISYLTLYAFSLENLKRSDAEKNCLFNLIASPDEKDIALFKDHGVTLKFVGDKKNFSPSICEAVDYIERETVHGKKLQVNVLFCYGGRQEIIAAACALAHKIKQGEIKEELIDENIFKQLLWSGDLPDPELIIRTGGVRRLSNFLTFQSAYSELYFLDCMWPDITEDHLTKAIEWYISVKRNFGV